MDGKMVAVKKLKLYSSHCASLVVHILVHFMSVNLKFVQLLDCVQLQVGALSKAIG